ncbi:MAG: RNA methyltransferase [Thermomicrobiales bacterium]
MSTSGNPEFIRSATNPAIALVRALGRRDRRAAERAFVVEGVRAVQDGLAAGVLPRLLLVRQGEEELLGELVLPPGTPVRIVERGLFDRLSEVQHPQGVLAVFPWPNFVAALDSTAPLVLVLDRLRDPGNLGTLLRAAAAAGVTAVFLTAASVDPWNAKVVRAGMGAHWRVPVLPFDAAAAHALRPRLSRRVAAAADANQTYDAVDWSGPAALIVGGEAEGVSRELLAWATESAAIPLAGGVESLNAAVAGAVMLFEAARQRRIKTGCNVLDQSR